MSVEGIAIRCTDCDFRSTTRKLFGPKSYLTPVGTIRVCRQSGWCEDCCDIVNMEDPDPEKRLEDINRDLDYLKMQIEWEEKRLNKPKGWFERNFCPRVESKSYLNELKDQFNLLEAEINQPEVLADYLNGTQPPHCLDCGSIRVRNFPYQASGLKTIGEPDMQWKPVGFQHPGCKGELVAAVENFRIHFIFTPRLYLLSGLEYRKKKSSK